MIDKKNLIYCDHSATTPVAPEVLVKMLPFFSEQYANASSLYTLARQSRNAIEEARDRVAKILSAFPQEIIFANSGTHSDNMAIIGCARAHKHRGAHIITSSIEHQAVLQTCKYLEKHEGFEVDYVPVDKFGLVDPNDIASRIKKETILVSIMYANNEIGTIQPIKKIVEKVKAENKNIIIHTDACQAPGLIPVTISELGVDMITLNGSKIYGPKGSGILYKRNSIKIDAIMFGGHQEEGYNPGTENVANIVGLSYALDQAIKKSSESVLFLTDLTEYFKEQLKNKFNNIKFNGHPTLRLVNNVHFSFPKIEAEAILFYLDKSGIMASSGSACTSKSIEPSHVLQAINLSSKYINGSLRFSFGQSNTKEQIDTIILRLSEIVTKLNRFIK